MQAEEHTSMIFDIEQTESMAERKVRRGGTYFYPLSLISRTILSSRICRLENLRFLRPIPIHMS